MRSPPGTRRRRRWRRRWSSLTEATLTPDPLHSACYDSHPPAAIHRPARGRHRVGRRAGARPHLSEIAMTLSTPYAAALASSCRSPRSAPEAQPKPFAAGDAAAGKAMVDSDLRRLPRAAFRHGRKVYLRADRRVHTPAQLLAQIALRRPARKEPLSRGGGAHRRLPQSELLPVQAMTATPAPSPVPDTRLLALAAMHCRPGAPRLSDEELRTHLAALPGWSFADNRIAKTYAFVDYCETMAFVKCGRLRRTATGSPPRSRGRLRSLRRRLRPTTQAA